MFVPIVSRYFELSAYASRVRRLLGLRYTALIVLHRCRPLSVNHNFTTFRAFGMMFDLGDTPIFESVSVVVEVLEKRQAERTASRLLE